MMIRKELLVAMSVLILLGSSLFAFVPVIGNTVGLEMEAGAPTQITSDFIVADGVISELNFVDYDMAGDIIVEDGGILYINESTIQFNCTEHGEFGITVEADGQLYMSDSNISAINKTGLVVAVDPFSQWSTFTGLGWYFEFYGSGEIVDSELSYMWGDQGNTQNNIEGGIQIYSSDVKVTDTKVFHSCNSGISILNPFYDYGSGVSPVLDNVIVEGTSGNGIFIMGDLSAPLIKDSRIIGSTNKGIFMFIGVDAVVNYTTLRDNEEDGAYIHDSGATGYTSLNEFNNCTFTGNGHGFGMGDGGAVKVTDSDIMNNMYSGVRDTSSANSPSSGIFRKCDISNNGESGLNFTTASSSTYFYDCDIFENGIHGVVIDTTSSVYLDDCNVYDNEEFGVWTNGTAATQISDSMIYGNPDGGLRATNGSIARLIGNEIFDSRYGALILSSNPTFSQNLIRDNDVGIRISGDSNANFGSGDIEDNRIGVFIISNDINVNGQNITGNTETGVLIANSDSSTVSFCEISNNPEGIKINGGDHNMIRNTTILSSTGAGIYLDQGANITVRGSGFSSNGNDFTLNGGSVARAYSIGTSASDVNVMDETSEFWHHWKITVETYNNVTLEPITQADLVIYSADGEMLSSAQTFFDGIGQCEAADFSIIGSMVNDYTPANLTVSKDGYVPHWNPSLPHTSDHSDIIYLAENKAPSLPIPINGNPVVTHMNRPLITWDLPYDWNDDRIEYTINVWQDEMGSGPHVVINDIAKNNTYQFTKNLRYNREFWVEVFAFDPWGLNDTATFSFRTINTPPTTPEASFVEAPVPSLIDLIVRIDEESQDDDTNPVDDISYLVQWEAFREDTWVIITTGSNAFVLDHNLTREGDRIRATIKPFDGIEYGIPIVLITDVINFAPEALIQYVEIELIEDTPEVGLLDLPSLFTDRDGDSLSFTVSVERRVSAEIDQATNEIRFIPDLDWAGTDYLLIEALDAKPHITDNPTVQVNVTVIPVNDAPVILEVNEKIIDKGEIPLVQDVQGASVVITVKGYDPDAVYGDEVEYSTNFAEVIGEGVLQEDDLIFEKTTGRMSIYLKNALVGEHIFNITITDDSGESTDMPIRLLVDNRNDAPTMPEITSHETGQKLVLGEGEQTVIFTISASDDPDLHIPGAEEKLQYDWSFGEGWLENKGLEMPYTFETTGEYEIRVRVKDSMGLIQETSIVLEVNVTSIPEAIPPIDDSKPFLEEYGLILLLVVVLIIVMIVILLVIIRKDDLSDTAEDVEKEHEVLVAKQQEDALIAQEKLQALMSGVAFSETTGPALPSAQPEGAGFDALPAAAPESIPVEGEDPMAQPPVDQYPQQDAYQEPPVTPEPAYTPEQPMQAAPAPAPIPEAAPPMPEPVPAPEAPGAVPPPEPQPNQDPSYLPPQE